MSNLTIGTTKEVQAVADESRLAVNVGSGTLRVLATPSVAALMEQAACELVQPFMAEGITTVGTMITIQHIRATAFNVPVKAVATLTDVTDRKYSFTVEAYDMDGLIAKGTHERFSVNIERFMSKLK